MEKELLWIQPDPLNKNTRIQGRSQPLKDIINFIWSNLNNPDAEFEEKEGFGSNLKKWILNEKSKDPTGY